MVTWESGKNTGYKVILTKISWKVLKRKVCSTKSRLSSSISTEEIDRVYIGLNSCSLSSRPKILDS